MIKLLQPGAVAQPPFVPQCSVRLLDGSGEARSVEQRRKCHALTQLFAQSSERLEVGCRCDRARHVLLRVAGYPVVESDRVQNAGAKPPEAGMARQ